MNNKDESSNKAHSEPLQQTDVICCSFNNFFCDDEFYRDLKTFIDINYETDFDFSSLDENYQIHCVSGLLLPIITYDVEKIADLAEEFSEEYAEEEYEEIKDSISQCVDFEKLNSLIPKLYYPIGKSFSITKADLVKNSR